eukprot:TRINITY_DN4776_c0_g7_i1.p1 TRINITY_DN4776_c0_g7~~TRINITY_DN4776_c0_g7_i1.p1  ORF type:complete len:158 (-),score=20.99 TRINITY_DN4776_c0_g7_i1:310-783(-)
MHAPTTKSTRPLLSTQMADFVDFGPSARSTDARKPSFTTRDNQSSQTVPHGGAFSGTTTHRADFPHHDPARTRRLSPHRPHATLPIGESPNASATAQFHTTQRDSFRPVAMANDAHVQTHRPTEPHPPRATRDNIAHAAPHEIAYRSFTTTQRTDFR